MRTGNWIAAATIVVLGAASARADVFRLQSGGRFEGSLVNADEAPRTKYVVRTSTGALVTLKADQVKEVEQPSSTEAEYETLRHQQPDTPDGHWALAEWCREHKLSDLRKQHLERIVELDPNHRQARGLLGFNQIAGQWKTRDEHMAAIGKVRYKGDWLFPQEIEINERKAEANRLRLEWIANLKRWKDWLGGPKDTTARSYIAQISDPAAVPALQQALADEEMPDAVRELYIRALGRIGSFDALMMLAERSLIDPSSEIRAVSLDLLTDNPQPAIVNYFIQQLHSKDNGVINGAAYALQRFKDDRAVAPLIDTLVTKHKSTVTSGGSGMSATNSSFGSGLTTGSTSQTFTKEMQNQKVLDALIVLVNGQVNYQFNVDAWKQWYAGRKKNKFVDARRN